MTFTPLQYTFLCNYKISLYFYSELSSISNLLGHELLKVVNHECEILDNDLAFVHFLQQGTGLYLLQALNILAEQVCCCFCQCNGMV